jgi:hypothetical protein
MIYLKQWYILIEDYIYSMWEDIIYILSYIHQMLIPRSGSSCQFVCKSLHSLN